MYHKIAKLDTPIILDLANSNLRYKSGRAVGYKLQVLPEVYRNVFFLLPCLKRHLSHVFMAPSDLLNTH
jgi:hypothetical protein